MQLKFDPRFRPPDDEVLRKIELSMKEVEGMEKRNLNCPICGFRILGLYSDRSGHVEVKCRKCKFEGTLNLAYFRRQWQHHRYIRLTDNRRKTIR